MKLKAFFLMIISMTCIFIEKGADRAITKMLVRKYCDEPIPEGFTQMEVCGTDYEAYLRMILLVVFLISSAIFLFSKRQSHMMLFGGR